MTNLEERVPIQKFRSGYTTRFQNGFFVKKLRPEDLAALNAIVLEDANFAEKLADELDEVHHDLQVVTDTETALTVRLNDKKNKLIDIDKQLGEMISHVGNQQDLWNRKVDTMNLLKIQVDLVNESKSAVNLEESKLRLFMSQVENIFEQDNYVPAPTYLDDSLYSYLSQALYLPAIEI